MNQTNEDENENEAREFNKNFYRIGKSIKLLKQFPFSTNGQVYIGDNFPTHLFDSHFLKASRNENSK